MSAHDRSSGYSAPLSTRRPEIPVLFALEIAKLPAQAKPTTLGFMGLLRLVIHDWPGGENELVHAVPRIAAGAVDGHIGSDAVRENLHQPFADPMEFLKACKRVLPHDSGRRYDEEVVRKAFEAEHPSLADFELTYVLQELVDTATVGNLLHRREPYPETDEQGRRYVVIPCNTQQHCIRGLQLGDLFDSFDWRSWLIKGSAVDPLSVRLSEADETLRFDLLRISGRKSAKVTVIPYPVVQGATVDQLSITFVNPDLIECRVGNGERKNYDYRSAGFGNYRGSRKTGQINPDSLWEFFYAMAKRDGVLAHTKSSMDRMAERERQGGTVKCGRETKGRANLRNAEMLNPYRPALDELGYQRLSNLRNLVSKLRGRLHALFPFLEKRDLIVYCAVNALDSVPAYGYKTGFNLTVNPHYTSSEE